MAKRGRPRGTILRLLDDPGRFEVAAWWAFRQLGLSVYPAAYLTHFLISIERPITIESVEGILHKATTAGRSSVIGHADRIRRNAEARIKRADAAERAWAATSAALIVAVVKFTAERDAKALSLTLDRLRDAGWTEVLSRLGSRVDAALRSNFPPAEGPLSRAAALLLREAKKSAA
jgi:hypothetical protein